MKKVIKAANILNVTADSYICVIISRKFFCKDFLACKQSPNFEKGKSKFASPSLQIPQINEYH